jgi:K(+)-stimulated pyrophosphate-energized sodium pump
MNFFMIGFSIIVSLVSIFFAVFLIRKISQAASGTEKMIEIAKYIREGAVAYLKRQFKTVGIVAAVLFFILGFALSFKVAGGFILGAFASALAGIIGMMVSTKANLKVAEASKMGLKPALTYPSKGVR